MHNITEIVDSAFQSCSANPNLKKALKASTTALIALGMDHKSICTQVKKDYLQYAEKQFIPSFGPEQTAVFKNKLIGSDKFQFHKQRHRKLRISSQIYLHLIPLH